MRLDDLRRRPPAAVTAVEYRRLAPRRVPAAAAPAPAPSPVPAARLAAAVPGEEVEALLGGRAWRARTTVPGPSTLPPGTLCLDLETTGLSAFPLFLGGVLSAGPGGRPEVRQYLARDYSEERAVVSLLLAETAAAAALVTYNGRSFDVPYLRARAAACGVPFALDLPHRDLLHECRRAYRDRLPDCRLATVEARILGVPRVADLPGREVPAAYHAFVRTGDPRDLARVMEHNRRDLEALAALIPRLGG